MARNRNRFRDMDDATVNRMVGWLFIFDWTGTLCSKKTRLLAPGAPAIVKAIRKEWPIAGMEILSIANGSAEERREEIEGLLAEAGIRDFFREITVIKPPKKPEHFINPDFRRIVVVGDRPCREIANGNLAGADTILIRDPEISECCDEPLVGEFEGVPYKGAANHTYPSLEVMAGDIGCGDMFAIFLGGNNYLAR